MMKLRDLGRKIFQEDKIIDFVDIRYLPRWVILVIDIGILILSMLISFFINERIIFIHLYFLTLLQISALILGINIIFMVIFRTYAGIIRHSTLVDLFKIFLAGACTAFFTFLVNLLVLNFSHNKLLPNVILLIYFAVSFLLLFVFRILVKEVFWFLKETKRDEAKKNVLILGTRDDSISIARAIIENPDFPYTVVGFLSDKIGFLKTAILGKSIFSKETFLQQYHKTSTIDAVIINQKNLQEEKIKDWVDFLLDHNIKILKVSSLQKLRDSNYTDSIENFQIEDLLNRPQIVIENEEINKAHLGKNILVTGGAGSIGSELIRQIALLQPAVLVILDQAETPLHEISLEMKQKFPNVFCKFILCDVMNYHQLEQIFEKYRFSVVYHAAAYKHVPIVEDNPQAAVNTNILGSKNLAILSSIYKTERFVMISTDKAVNPTNVMGATKRVAEIYVQSLQNIPENQTKFITTRFGNVLDSNGSVIPLFKKQIKEGGPITITHPEIVRYFMTIQEACELVLQAGTMGKGGEVYVFDMGSPVKILDMANKMIKLSGMIPGEDIKIIFTGLRPGEKLFEELLSDTTKTLPTYHQKIMISKDIQMPYEKIQPLVNLLITAIGKEEKSEIVKILKKIVPEFKSNNSIYQLLD